MPPPKKLKLILDMIQDFAEIESVPPAGKEMASITPAGKETLVHKKPLLTRKVYNIISFQETSFFNLQQLALLIRF